MVGEEFCAKACFPRFLWKLVDLVLLETSFAKEIVEFLASLSTLILDFSERTHLLYMRRILAVLRHCEPFSDEAAQVTLISIKNRNMLLLVVETGKLRIPIRFDYITWEEFAHVVSVEDPRL